MKQTLKNHYQRKVTIAIFCLLTFGISAQERYSFHCKEYISTDNNRAPQTNFSYDTAKNLFAIKSSGTNNVAFKMSSEADGKYYIPNDNYWFVIAVKNVNTALSDSRVWWFNGYCNGGQSPTKVFTNSDATQLLMWNIKTAGSMGTNMDFTQQKIVISSHNNEFIHAIGLTSSIGKGTITDVNYYAPYEVVTEEHEKGMRFVLLLNGLHKVEFHGTEAECMKNAEAFVESGDMSKAVNVNAQ